MDTIRLLPDVVANQIAAGEVIQRPSSCLKELVENSIDASATRIQIILRDSGRTLLQVIDNGKGMSEMDARLAFERHATSKIAQASDLFQIHTLGFRGEALPSICAVAQVELQTRRAQDEVGIRLEIDGSQLVLQEPVSCTQGTNIRVKNLFYNVPVRRKFLKSDQTEMRNVVNEFLRIALAYPNVQFTLVHQDEIIYDLPTGSEKQRIESLFQKSQRNLFSRQLLEIQCDTELVSIRGFVAKPESANKQPQQYFFVNGRYMRHPYFHKAIMTAYQGMVSGEDVPSYFIYMEVDPQTIDVNIHPTKTEIKFENEQPIFQILMASVREALGKFNISPALDFDAIGKIEMPVPTKQTISQTVDAPVTTRVNDYNPFKAHSFQIDSTPWQPLYESAAQLVRHNQPEPESFLFESQGEITKCYQYASRYILCSSREGLMVIDQHRAHIRILYNLYYRQMERAASSSQRLLFPEVWDVDEVDMDLVNHLLYDLRQLGFELEQLDKRAFTIIGIPPQMQAAAAIPTLAQMVLDVKETDTNIREESRKKMALRLAIQTAIPYGKVLSEDEMHHLVEQLLSGDMNRITPDGKTIITIFEQDEIEKRF